MIIAKTKRKSPNKGSSFLFAAFAVPFTENNYIL